MTILKGLVGAYCKLVFQHAPEGKNTHVTVSRNCYSERRYLLSQKLSEDLLFCISV